MSMSSSTTHDQLETISSLVSVQRLRSYLDATNDQLPEALALYEWNSRISVETFLVIGMIEIFVRNAMDRVLTDWMNAQPGSPDWLHSLPFNRRARRDIKIAQKRASRTARPKNNHGKTIAELNFGFWRFLASKSNLTTLWTPALHGSFPHGNSDIKTRREEVASRLQNLNLVRNRVAHLEPIHRRDLERDLNDAINLANWIDPVAGEWLSRQSRIHHVLAEMPMNVRRPT